MRTAPMMSAVVVSGSIVMNSQCQSAMLRMKPERLGPTAGATAMTVDTVPMTCPRFAGATSANTVVKSMGMTIAVPLAWMTRATMSSSKTGATAPSSVPAVNRAIAVTNSARVLNRCSSQPVIGMTTARVSMNAVVSHCAVLAVMPNTSMKRGIATPMRVSLRMTTKAEPMSTPSTMRRCASETAGGATALSGEEGVVAIGSQTYSVATPFPDAPLAPPEPPDRRRRRRRLAAPPSPLAVLPSPAARSVRSRRSPPEPSPEPPPEPLDRVRVRSRSRGGREASRSTFGIGVALRRPFEPSGISRSAYRCGDEE